MSTKAAATPPTTLIPQRTSATRTNATFGVTIPQESDPVQIPAFELPAGAVAYVRALPNNLATLVLATSKANAAAGIGQILAPNTQVAFPCLNTREMWIGCLLWPATTVGPATWDVGQPYVICPGIAALCSIGTTCKLPGAGVAGADLVVTITEIYEMYGASGNAIAVIPNPSTLSGLDAVISGLSINLGAQISILG